MFKTPLRLASLLLAEGVMLALAATAWGQVGPAERILKERARGATNNITQRSGNPNYTPPAKGKATTPSRPPTAQPAIVIPELTGTQLTASRQLRKDLNAIEAKPDAASAHTETLTQDLLAAAAGTKQPGLNQLMALAGDLAAGWPAQKLADSEKDQFANNLVHLLNCGGQPAAATQKIYQSTEALLKKSGMGEAESRRINGSLKAIVTQLQR